jgi:zeaxanthin glucosyltransferase
MSHFGVLSYKGAGHLNPLITLSRQLVARGHRVTFVHDVELEARIRLHGLEFCAIAASIDRSQKDAQSRHRKKPSSAVPLLRYRIRRTVNDMERFLRETPQALTRVGVDALIIDELALAGPTVAEVLRLPYFVISTSVPHNFGWSAPRSIAPPKSLFTRVQSALLEVSILQMRGPVRRRLDNFRRQVQLGSIREIRNTFPALAHITQLPRCLDFPRSGLPPTFHYTGPFVDETARISMQFPWDQLDERPVIYASLGTTLKGEPATFHLIAEACDGLGMQLVMAIGGRRDPGIFRDMPGKPLIVKEAPQLELLKKAEIVITHAGSNTVFETLLQGKPMIAIPKTFDQPAIAARLAWLGAAIVLRPDKLSAQEIRSALSTLLSDPSYRNAARGLQAKIRSEDGLERATDLIEQSMRNHIGGV